jgi:hypothetical protein
MSRVEIYSISNKGDVELYAEERNAVACAWLMWDTFNKKYNLSNKEMDFKELWEFTGTDKMSRQDKIAVASAFDRVWIKKEHLKEVADAWDAAWELVKARGDRVDTISRVAAVIRKAADEDIRGICFNQTSVCCNPWVVTHGEDEEETFNFDKHTEISGGKPWELFEWLNSPE